MSSIYLKQNTNEITKKMSDRNPMTYYFQKVVQSLGSPTILRADKRTWDCLKALAIIQYDRRIMLPEFLCEQLKTDDIQRQFKIGTKVPL